jgi:hypothetical protein
MSNLLVAFLMDLDRQIRNRSVAYCCNTLISLDVCRHLRIVQSPVISWLVNQLIYAETQ